MDRVVKILGYAGGLAIAAMMILIVGEVASRTLLGRSIPGALEIVGICLSLAVFLGFAPGEQAGEHVKVDLLRVRVPPAHRMKLDLVVSLVGLTVVAVMTWAVGVDAYRSLSIREVLPGAGRPVPVYPARIGAFVGFLAFGVQLLRNTLARRPGAGPAVPDGDGGD